jgi:Cof subfamily protein (haloacid dehalogenase superfamily)
MKQKLIFLDIDGTLTPAGTNTPPDSALAAIRAAQKNGHKVFLCTGRNLAMLSPLLKYGFDGMVASAGGYVTCGDKVLYDCPMTDAQFRTAMDKLHEGGVFCTVEAKDASYGDENLNAFLAGAGEGNSEIERWRRALAEELDIRPMHEYDGRPVYKIVVMCRQDAQLDPARAVLEQDFAFCMQDVAAHNCRNGELINRKFDKGRGVLRICEALGCSPADTVGFGDSMNDWEMMQAVGTSVCMGNGSPRLKEISTMVCPAVEQDGIAAAFAALKLC